MSDLQQLITCWWWYISRYIGVRVICLSVLLFYYIIFCLFV